MIKDKIKDLQLKKLLLEEVIKKSDNCQRALQLELEICILEKEILIEGLEKQNAFLLQKLAKVTDLLRLNSMNEYQCLSEVFKYDEEGELIFTDNNTYADIKKTGI